MSEHEIRGRRTARAATREPTPDTAYTPSRHASPSEGLAAIDMRTVAAREMLAFRGELVAALGGDAELSPQRRKLVDLTRTVESRRAEVMG